MMGLKKYAVLITGLILSVLPAFSAVELLAGHYSNRTLGWDTNHVGVIALLNSDADRSDYFNGVDMKRDGTVTSTDLSWGSFGSDAPSDTTLGGSLNNDGTVATQSVFMALVNNSLGSNLVLNAVHFDINRGTTDMPVHFKLDYVSGDLGDAVTVYDLTVGSTDFMNVGSEASGDFDDVDWTLATEGSQSGTSASPVFNAMSDVTLAFGEIARFEVTIIGDTNISEALNIDNFMISGEFVEAEVAPKTFVTGTRIDTDFSAADSPAYADGDLADQNGWIANTNSGSYAFNIDSGDSGWAETVSVSNYFDTTLGNQVLFDDSDQWTTNGVGSEWSGTVSFSFHTGAGTKTPAESREVAPGVTNTFAVAQMDYRQVLHLGLTATPNTLFDQGNASDLTLNFWINGGEGLAVTFDSGSFASSQIALVGRADIGWDPQWDAVDTNGYATAAPDFDSDVMVCDYLIRKTAIADTYIAKVDVTVGGVLYEGTPTIVEKTVVYASDGLKMAMSHDADSDKDGTYSLVNVAVDSLSMTHSASNPPPAYAPVDMAASVGDLAASVSWAGAFEADSIELFRSENDGVGPYTSLTNGVAYAYEDSGLTDKRTYFYTTVAHYDGYDSPRSEQAIVRALAKTPILEWGHATDIISANLDFEGLTKNDPGSNLTNGIVNYVGTGVDGSIVDSSGIYNSSSYPLVYGIAQHTDDGSAATDDRWSNVHKFQNSTPSDYIKIDALLASTVHSALLWIEGSSIDAVSTQTGYEIETFNSSGNARAAVRNGTTWYVSETEFAVGEDAITDLSAENWAELTPATLDSTSLMTVSGATFSNQTLDNITAVGFFMDSIASAADKNIRYFGLLQSTPLTAYEQWADEEGIYNEDAASTNDFDGDGLSNLEEWAFGGNPTDAAGLGIQERGIAVDGTSTNIVYIYPRRKDASSRPMYTVVQTDDLVTNTWTEAEILSSTSGGTWADDRPNFEAVTNIVPADLPVKFLTVEISE